MTLPTDLREFFESLISNDVDFLIVGAYALAFHGLPRLTSDVDVLVGMDLNNAGRVVKALQDFGFGSLGIQSEDFAHEDRVLVLGVEPNKVDLFTTVLGVEFGEAWRDRVRGELGGLEVWYLSREHLIRAKRAAGRPKDIADLAMLLGEESDVDAPTG